MGTPSSALLFRSLTDKADNGGKTLSGASTGGEGSWFWGNGGDGTSGNTGSTNGGSIDNNGNVIYGSAISNQAGSGGTSQSGTATGGNAKRQLFGLFDPFASSGGSATTGSTGDSNGGDVTNGGNAIVSSIVANKAGNGGKTLSGAATGGEGSWFWGNGGDGTSGSTGNTDGGSIDNEGNIIYGSAVS
ncbi:hypothetical protein BXZ70DRAFT_928230, partial [Cristinia sonorae]